jgi:tetratricopeptide (TPR) repeat protein
VRAVEYHERALALYRALRDRHREAGSLANLAAVYSAQGNRDQAAETEQNAVSLLLQLPVSAR